LELPVDSCPVVMYFPYPSVGGVSVLFLRVAKMLKDSRRVILMDLKDGYMARNLPEGVEFIAHDEKHLVPRDAVVVFQACFPWTVSSIDQFPRSARLLFWHLHPDNYQPYFLYKNRESPKPALFSRIVSFSRFRKVKTLVCDLLSKSALVFMDGPNFKSTMRYFSLPQRKPEYLRIFTDSKEDERISEASSDLSGRNIRLGWLGRVEDFKTPILLHTLERLSALDGIAFSITIVGWGSDLDQIREFSQKNPEMNINVIGEINYEDIPECLAGIDILFAMGASALEGAKAGIPTIVLDYSFKEINGLYKYEIIYEKEDFSVGQRIVSEGLEKSCTLQVLLTTICNDYRSYSEKCYAYWLKNFSVEVFLPKFFDSINNTKFTFSDVIKTNMHKADLSTKIFSRLRRILGRKTANEGWNF
jgi:hypothetical protein